MEVEIKTRNEVVTLKGDATECAEVLNKLVGVCRDKFSVVRQEEYPKRVTRAQPKGKKHQASYKYRQWADEELQATKKFYKDANNHFKNGYIVKGKLEAFAKSIGRSPTAVQVKAIELGLTNKKLKGPHKQKNKKKTKEQMRWTPERRKAHSERMKLSHAQRKRKQADNVAYGANRFPSFRMAAVDNEVVKTTLHDMMLRNGKMNLQQAVVLGITTREQWGGFIREMLVNSKRVADYYHMPNKFRIVATRDEQVLVYGDA